jgi:AcrR family transcriptional regulator
MKREEAIEERRQSIFNAARILIRENRSTDFSMPLLAKCAGLSNATTYNIIGSKSTVLYHLLDQCAEELLALAVRNSDCGFSHKQALAAADAAIAHFVTDPDLYRPLMQHLLGLSQSDTRPSFMSKALRYWRISLGVPNTPNVATDIRNGDLAQIFHILFIGAMNAWIYGDLDAEGMRRWVEEGIALVLRGSERCPLVGDNPG